RIGGRSDQVLASKQPIVLENRGPEAAGGRPSETLREGFAAAAWIPILLKDKAVGIINLASREPGTFLRDQIPLLEAIGASLGVALENARLFREAELRAQEQAVLNSIAMTVNQSLHLDELLQISLNKVLDVTGRDAGYIRLKDPTTGALRLAAHRGVSQDYVDILLHHRTPGGKGERVFQSGEPLIINDPEETMLREETRRQGHRALAWIPLKARGKVVGILNISTSRPIPFDDREVQLLVAIGNVIGVALENAQLFEDSERLVRELEETTQQLSAKNKELDSFVYTVSHDLKAPLISLEGMAALLLDEYAGKLDEGAQHYLKRLMASSKQMEGLIIDLLALSRIGREGRSPEGVSLNQIVDDLMLEWGETIRAKNIHVTRHELPKLWGVRVQVQQVMTNLLSNAVKYLGARPDPMIEIGAKENGGKMIECYVKDNGIGIDPQYHEKVFETFQRLKEIETEGTGVGLAIVRKIIEGAGGRVWVESAKGEGATFRFTWPKTQAEVTA
ncbi:MAG: sensor histidine kinase, partial [Candidatus Binatia bacterium]